MRYLVFILVPVVFIAYVLNKYFIEDTECQWVVYFISEGIVSTAVGLIMLTAFYNMRMKLPVLAAGWYLTISIFGLISEILGQRQIGMIIEPIWVGLCLISMAFLLWKYLKSKNHIQQ